MDFDLDLAVRTAAFAFLADQARTRGEGLPPVLPLSVLRGGFVFRGQRVNLLFAGKGIFKPAILPAIPISITTAAPEVGKAAPYDDGLGDDGLVTYRYRGTDPSHPDNVGLRRAMVEERPLVYFLGVIPGRYLTFWPALVTGDNRRDLSFQVTLDLDRAVQLPELAVEENPGRSYAFRVVKQRLHQVSFRERVLAAYRRTCSLCQLRHEELLDAAHIIPDGQPRGDPIIPNGLALCKLHHAAFDSNIIGIRPDLVIEVRKDILRETDGPMLLHGLQGLHGSIITVPREARLRPAGDRLEARYEQFRRAG
ncbi:MAG: HNH endonuclease [Candidatus Dormibacteria bacterium]